MEASRRSVSRDINSPSFRCFANVRQSQDGLDLVGFRSSFDASDEESMIEIDLVRSSSNCIRVISITKDIEFSFPLMGSTATMDRDDKLSVGPSAFDQSESHTARHNPSSSSEPNNMKSLLASTRNLKPFERMVTACVKFLKPTFRCFRGQKPNCSGKVDKAQHPTARNIAIHPENSSSTITLAELFPKGLTENNGSSPKKSHKQ